MVRRTEILPHRGWANGLDGSCVRIDEAMSSPYQAPTVTTWCLTREGYLEKEARYGLYDLTHQVSKDPRTQALLEKMGIERLINYVSYIFAQKENK